MNLDSRSHSYKACAVSLIGIVLSLVLSLLFSCRSQKVIERTDSRDSAYVERSESIVYVQVTTVVEIPAQTAERETRDSTSHLETAFAQSDASIVWHDGVPYLNHSLANKPQKIEKTQTVPVKQIRLRYFRKIYRTIYKSKIIEKQLSLYQKAMLNFGPWIMIAMVIYIIYTRARLRR